MTTDRIPPSHRYGYETNESALRFEKKTGAAGAAKDIAYHIQTIDVGDIDSNQLEEITAQLRKIEEEVRAMVRIINDRNAIMQARIDRGAREVTIDPQEEIMLHQIAEFMTLPNTGVTIDAY